MKLCRKKNYIPWLEIDKIKQLHEKKQEEKEDR